MRTRARITGRATGSAPIPRAAASSRTTGSSRRGTPGSPRSSAPSPRARPRPCWPRTASRARSSPTGRRARAPRAKGALLVAPADVDSPLHTPDEVRSFSPIPMARLAVSQHRRGEHRRPVLHDGARGRLRDGVGEPAGDPRARRPHQCRLGPWPLARGAAAPRRARREWGPRHGPPTPDARKRPGKAVALRANFSLDSPLARAIPIVSVSLSNCPWRSP